MKVIFILFAFCLFSWPSLSQTDLPALESQLPDVSGVEKVKLLNKLAEHHLPTAPEKAISYATQSVILIREISESDVKISRHKLTIDKQILLEKDKRVIDLATDEVDAHNLLGRAYYQQNNYAKAVKELKSSLEICERHSYPQGQSTALEYLIILDETLKADTGGKSRKDRSVRSKIDDLNLDARTERLSLPALEKIAGAYEKANNINQAVKHYLRTVRFYEADKDRLKIANTYNHIADLYKRAGNYKDALKYYDMAIHVKEQLGDTMGVASSLDKVKTIYEDLNTYNAKFKGTTAAKPTEENIRKEIPEVASERSYKALSDNFAMQGDYKKSLEYFKLYADLKDKMLNDEKNRQLEMMEADFLIKGKSKEIALLQQQRQIQELDLRKKELELNRQRMLRNSLLGGLLFIILIAILFFWQFRSKRKAHQRLQAAYQNLEATHQKLKSTQTQLVQSEKMASLGQLTAGIAHEINNPINFVSANIQPLKSDVADVLKVLKTYDEVIRQNKLNEHFQEVENLKKEMDLQYVTEEIDSLLSGMDEGARRTREIVKGLRDFSRLDENGIKRFNVHESLDSTLVLLRTKYQDRITILKEYGELPIVEGFPGKINQVFMNVLNNAIQAIPERGTITIRTRLQNDQVVISIADTGIGMSPEVKQRIFEPFFTTKDVGEGTGLGLAITFGIIQQHKGSIQVDSTPGKGTEFHISIPVKQ